MTELYILISNAVGTIICINIRKTKFIVAVLCAPLRLGIKDIADTEVMFTTILCGIKDRTTAVEFMSLVDYICKMEADSKYREACEAYDNAIKEPKKLLPAIKNVIFKNPATIVFWADGTKTVVRTQDNESYDPEKGLAMAMCKKMLGNERDYYHTFLHWMKKA